MGIGNERIVVISGPPIIKAFLIESRCVSSNLQGHSEIVTALHLLLPISMKTVRHWCHAIHYCLRSMP